MYTGRGGGFTGRKTVELTAEARQAIEAAQKRGKDVQIQRKGGGYIILEVTKKIIYRSPGQ